MIIRPDVFSENVLPKYFPSSDSRSSTKYPSFTRKLNRWGFRQATRGPDTGAFHHPLFRRDQTNLCLDMVCQKSRKRSSNGTSAKSKGAVTTEEANKVSESHHSIMQRNTTAVGTSALAHQPVAPMPPTQVIQQPVASLPAVAGCASGTVQSTINPALPPVTNLPAAPAAWLPTDATLVSAALKAREEMERVQVAKSMLYDAYIKALRG